MNASAQYLKKQNERLLDQNRVLMAAFENLHAENEYLASVACGFAWDLAATCVTWKFHHTEKAFEWGPREYDTDATQMLKFWDDALAAVEAQNAEEKK